MSISQCSHGLLSLDASHRHSLRHTLERAKQVQLAHLKPPPATGWRKPVFETVVFFTTRFQMEIGLLTWHVTMLKKEHEHCVGHSIWDQSQHRSIVIYNTLSAMGKPKPSMKVLKKEATKVPGGLTGERPIRSKRDKERSFTTKALKMLGAPPVESLVVFDNIDKHCFF